MSAVLKDFSDWKEYEGAAEGSGRSEKIWLLNPKTNETGLFKLKKDAETTDHLSECMAYDIATLLKVPCARYELGTYKGREGSMSYNVIDTEQKILVEGLQVITSVFPQYNDEQFVDEKTGLRYSLELIEAALEKYGLFQEFLYIPIFDFLIGNTDRHHSNWAFIKENETYSFSPLYDNSSSLCAYLSEKQCAGYLTKDKLRWNSLTDTKSKSLIRIAGSDKSQPTHLQVLQVIHQKYCADTEDFVQNILTTMTEGAICGIVEKYDNRILQENKKQVIKKFLSTKVSLLKSVYEGGCR